MKRIIQRGLRRLGYEIKKYSLETSIDARLAHILQYYKINLILDVGANEGHSAKHYRKVGYTGEIVSFEALQSAHLLLSKNSQHDAKWHIAPRIAIGDHKGEVTLNIAANSFSSSILSMENQHVLAAPESQYVGEELVPMATLDECASSYLLPSSCIFLKMDVQGFEAQVLQGASEILHKVLVLQTEMSFTPLYKGERLYDEMIAYLDDLGFELYAIIPGFSDPQTGKMLQADGIFVTKNLSQ